MGDKTRFFSQSERALYGNFITNTIRLYWVCIKLGEKNGNYFNNKSVPIKRTLSREVERHNFSEREKACLLLTRFLLQNLWNISVLIASGIYN